VSCVVVLFIRAAPSEERRDEDDMDLLASTDLEELARRDRYGVHVSLFMPTHRFGRGVQADRIRWKNTVTSARGKIAYSGFRSTFRKSPPSVNGSSWVRCCGSSPATSNFLLLALSQRELRLLEGSRHRVEEVVLPDVPSSLRDVVAPPEPRSDTMAFATSPAARGGPAVLYGHGTADEDFKRDEVERFLRRVADGLDSYLAGEDLPLVLIGLDCTVAHVRRWVCRGSVPLLSHCEYVHHPVVRWLRGFRSRSRTGCGTACQPRLRSRAIRARAAGTTSSAKRRS
jgi:hypothetical protein